MMKLKKNPQTQDDARGVAEVQARKFLHLLKNTVPVELQKDFIDLLPEMTLEQIERLIDLLESEYLDKETRHIDEKYKNKLAKLSADFQVKQKSMVGEFKDNAKTLLDN